MRVADFEEWCLSHHVCSRFAMIGPEFVVKLIDVHTRCVQAHARAFTLEQAIAEARRKFDDRLYGAVN